MIRGVLFFFALWGAVTIGILQYQHLTSKEQVNVLKAVRYGAITAVIAFVLVVGMVFIF